MYDPADTPFELYVHPSTLSTTGAAIPRSQNTRISNPPSTSHPATHLALPPSTLRTSHGSIGLSNPIAVGTTNSVPGPIYRLPTTLHPSNGGRFSTSNLPSVLDEYVNKYRSNPGPSHYRIPEHRIQSISMGKATRPIFKRIQGSDEPAPGAYNVTSHLGNKKGGVKFGQVPLQRRSPLANEPGPGHFQPKYDYLKPSRGTAKISDAQLPSESDLSIRRNVPGPGTYNMPDGRIKGTTKFSTNIASTALERHIKQAATMPGPGHTHSDYLINHGRKTNSSGKMSTAFPKTELDWIIWRSKDVPAPGDYDLQGLGGRSKGMARGRFSTSNVPSFTDVAVRLSQQVPAPGEYRPQKEYTLSRTSSVPFMKTERFPGKRVDRSIVDSSGWIKKKSVPDRPGDYKAPSFSMGCRMYPVEKIDRSIHSPTRLHMPDAFGSQVRSDKPNAFGFSWGKGKEEDPQLEVNSPVKKSNIGPSEYNVWKSYAKTYNRKDWGGKDAKRQALLKKARKNLSKWRSQYNF